MTAQPIPSQSLPKLSLYMLVALVVGSMIGSGIFNLPQNMAVKAGSAAILISWFITGIGMLMLCFVYQNLSMRKTELNNGIYAYARASAGEFIGFNSAWGYWISALLGNVSYLIAIFAALGYFFPIFGEGNTVTAVIGASIILWILHSLILHGIKNAARLNAIITLSKVLPLVLFIIVTLLAFNLNIFQLNFWNHFSSSSLLEQVKNSMIITVWVFIGIEGASVYSARAKNRHDIGKATFIGFIITLFLLVAISLLSTAILPQATLAELKNISMAGVIEKITGRWGALVIIFGMLLSIGGALLAWTLLAAETLFTPAKDGLLPKWFVQENSRNVPANALWLTNGLIQLFLIMTFFSKTTYLALISLSTSMILIPYFFSAVYAIQITLFGDTYKKEHYFRYRDFIISLIATIYCCWLLYAAGIKYLYLSSILYFPGGVFFMIARHQQGKRRFQSFEKLILCIILVLAITAGYLLSIGKLTL